MSLGGVERSEFWGASQMGLYVDDSSFLPGLSLGRGSDFRLFLG